MARHPDADLPYDKGVLVPSAVRAAGERAEALMAEARGETPPGTVEPPAPQPPGKEAPIAPPAPVQTQHPVAQSEAPSQAPPQNPAPPLNSEESWEMRFRSMKGRYDVLVDQSQRAMNEANARISALENQLRAAPPAPPSSPTIDTSKFDEEDDATWGPDFRMAVQRRVDAAVAELTNRLGSRVAQVEAGTQEQRMDALNRQLDAALPGGNGNPSWRDLNIDPQFLAWLELRDPLSGARRLDMLRNAYAEFDAQRVHNFFASFIAEAAPAPAGGQPGSQVPAPIGELPPPSNRLSLASLAAPGPARPAASAPPTAPQPKRIWTNAEIGKFFSAKSRGLYDGTPENIALRDAYEQDIFLAQAEGRVVPG